MPENFKDSQLALEQAVSLARMEEKLVALEANQQRTETIYKKEMEELQEKVSSLSDERDKALKWGLVLLGSTVLSLLGWVVKLLSGGKFPTP